jgi:tRNA pseudouridine(55) synthase
MDIIRAWKRIGETPSQVINRVKQDYNITNIAACYTNRLDPMAQGVITILFGPSVHKAPSFNKMDKVYQFQAILGISTHSYDAMGRHTNYREVKYEKAQLFVEEMLKLNDTEYQQSLPPCSAYRHNGKPLWQHTIDNTLPSPLPTKKVKVITIKFLQDNPTQLDFCQYRSECLDDIRQVRRLNENANFQFNQIISDWNELNLAYVWRVPFEVHVSSGTYVRGLVHDICTKIGIPGHAFRITRFKCL